MTGKLLLMPYTDDERRKIGDAVRKARIAQELDKEPAARAAKVNSITWKRVEDAEGVRDASLSKILGSLGLPGADEILEDLPAELSGSGSLTATAEASGNVVVQPGAARVVRLDEVPILDLVDEVRRRVVSLVAPPSHIDDVTRGFATIQNAIEDEKDRAGLGDRPRQRGDGVKRRGHSPPNVG